MSASSRFQPGEGDWICGDSKCKNVNFAKRQKCNKCGKEKDVGIEYKKAGNEIGKNLAEKSKGLFAADDWMCKACGNVNWARRMSCNVCNAPKFGNTEPRTGYGGGFMEREEVVQYKESRKAEQEDEYDEFGRKRKKFRGNAPQASILSKDPTPPPNDDTEENDEDEDDDDDVDMSKYKLDSDEEEDGEDEDLSKYDLVASDDDQKKEDKKDESRSSPSIKSSSSSRSSSSRSSSRSRSRSRDRRRDRRRSRSRSSSRHRRSRDSRRHGRRSRSSSRSRSRSRERRRSYRSRFGT